MPPYVVAALFAWYAGVATYSFMRSQKPVTAGLAVTCGLLAVAFAIIGSRRP